MKIDYQEIYDKLNGEIKGLLETEFSLELLDAPGKNIIQLKNTQQIAGRVKLLEYWKAREQQEHTYVVFKYYDKRGRRLSIFAEKDVENKEVHITIFTFSKKEKCTFSRREARRKYAALVNGVPYEGDSPLSFTIPYEDYAKTTFLEWCDDNLYQPYEYVKEIGYKFLSGIEIDAMLEKEEEEEELGEEEVLEVDDDTFAIMAESLARETSFGESNDLDFDDNEDSDLTNTDEYD